jgi:hypothetical protein
MRNLIKTCAFAVLLALPTLSYAQDTTTPKAETPAVGSGMMTNCPPFTDTSGMQRDLGSMMSQMQAMMNSTTNPAMKERMQNMHEHMAAMMVNMQRMGAMGGAMGNMMGGGRGIVGGRASGNAAPETSETTAPASPEVHDAHHPDQQ